MLSLLWLLLHSNPFIFSPIFPDWIACINNEPSLAMFLETLILILSLPPTSTLPGDALGMHVEQPFWDQWQFLSLIICKRHQRTTKIQQYTFYSSLNSKVLRGAWYVNILIQFLLVCIHRHQSRHKEMVLNLQPPFSFWVVLSQD